MATELSQRQLLTLPEYFKALARKIEPPQERKDAAATIPDDVREYLKSSTDLVTEAPHSRLTGSYARHTAIHAIKDVDVVVFIEAGEEDPDPGETLEVLYKVLKGLPDELGFSGRAQILRRQRRSVHVEFDGEDFHLDVVPALIRDGIDEPLRVPDWEWNTWERSDPLGYGKALSALNRDTGGKAVRLIKLFKHWRTIQMVYRRPKSYYLEALTYRHLGKGWVTTDGKSDAELFTDLLRSIHTRFQPALDGNYVPKIPDPMLGHNVAFNWEWAAFKSFMTELDQSIKWAERALDKDRDDLDEAIELWQKIFGADYFEDTSALRRIQRAAWLASGNAIYVTGAGRVLGEKPISEPAVISPRHRFFGDAN
jgi:hypothetical protein